MCRSVFSINEASFIPSFSVWKKMDLEKCVVYKWNVHVSFPLAYYTFHCTDMYNFSSVAMTKTFMKWMSDGLESANRFPIFGIIVWNQTKMSFI